MRSLYLREKIFAGATLILWILVCAIPAALAQKATPYDGSSAVILSYQRIGEDAYPATNIRYEQFQDHIKELTEGAYKYNIMPLPEILKQIKAQKSLPPRTIAITFNGGYKSVAMLAAPLLIEHNIPFTLFVSTDNLDSGVEKYMNWYDVKKLQRSGLVTIGLHPAAYIHPDLENETTIKAQINKAKTHFREQTGANPDLFAYPFGEYSNLYKSIVAESGFTAAFGQQSGVAYSGSDMYEIPRFTMTESYGDLDRFRMVASALPLPVTHIEPNDPHLKTQQPAIGFTVDDSLTEEIDNISCFASGQKKPKLDTIGKNRVEIRLSGSFDEERARINCTMPGPPTEAGEEQRWRWFGMLLTLPQPMMDMAGVNDDMSDTDEESE